MIFGIGSDLVAFARIEKLYAQYGVTFAQKILSSSELLEFEQQTQPARFLMKRFAAKEALAKAAGSGLRHPLTLRSVSVAHDVLGKPIFIFDAELATHFAATGVVRHHLSISDELEMAVAFVVLERD